MVSSGDSACRENSWGKVLSNPVGCGNEIHRVLNIEYYILIIVL